MGFGVEVGELCAEGLALPQGGVVCDILVQESDITYGATGLVLTYHDEGFFVESLRFVERRASTAFIMISGC